MYFCPTLFLHKISYIFSVIYNSKIVDFSAIFDIKCKKDDFAKIVFSPRRNTRFSGLEVQKVGQICRTKRSTHFVGNRQGF